MKLQPLVALCAALVINVPGFAADPAADALWTEIVTLQKAERPKADRVDGKIHFTPAFMRATEKRNQEIGDRLMQFIDGNPSDPRRWDAILALAANGRMVVSDLGDVGELGWEAVKHDERAELSWHRRTSKLLEEMTAAPAITDQQRLLAYERWADNARAAAGVGGDLAEFRRRLDVLREKFPGSRQVAIGEWQYLNRLRKADPAAAKPWLESVAQWPLDGVATWARGELAVERLRETPMQMKFTALDGREVDLEKMRGKVVLIDFWATWCGPCIAEIPNVKRVYEEYHDKGFEVVAITLDADKDKQKLIDMCAEKELPWPQHFDGQGGKNQFAAQYGVMAIPSMFLLDKSGRLVATDARGPKLEEEVKKYLAR